MQTRAESENSMTITVSPTKPQETRIYAVKVMNQGRKSDYTIEKLSLKKQFTTISDVKQCLSDALKFQVENCGYLEPGHGLKGRQQWLVQDEDLQEMYAMYQKRREIMLWCIRPFGGSGTRRSGSDSKKRSNSEGPGEASQPPKTKRTTCSQKTKDVEDIIGQLREKHGQAYSTEQLSCWAHLYHMEKHGSLDTPPSLPFFSGKKTKKATQQAQPSVCQSPATTQSPHVGFSPTKRVNLRSESIKQLVEWHSLLEKGGISQQQHDDVQQAILKDIKDNMV